jgi:hypothetical protein
MKGRGSCRNISKRIWVTIDEFVVKGGEPYPDPKTLGLCRA